MDAKPHVLVVDDEPGPRESLKIILKQEYEVTATPRGSEALDLLSKGSYAVVLLDLTMPNDLSGTQTLRAIRDKGFDVEAIVITGQGALETAVESLRLGARDYLAKPYRASEVLAAVRSALSARDARLKAVNVKDQFLGNLSHEFRTPLNAIVGYSSILHEEMSEVLTAEQRRALARIQLNSERLLSYLEGLFFLTELDTGDVPLRPREFQVRPWLESLLRPISREASENGVAIQTICPDELVGTSNPETLARLIGVLVYEATVATRDEAIAVACEAMPDGTLSFAIRHQAGSILGEEGAAGEGIPIDAAPAGNRLACEVVERAARALAARIEKRTLDDRRTEVRVMLPAPNGRVLPPVNGRSAATGATAVSGLAASSQAGSSIA